MANLQKGVLDKMLQFLKKKKFSFEMIVVDDGSKDGSVEFVEAFAKEHSELTIIKNKHLGKAGAVTTGMLKALGKYHLFTDMDQATPIEELDKLLPFLEKDFAVAIGSRSTTRKGAPLTRQFISRSNIILRKLIVGLPKITDTQCGFKMFTKEASVNIFQKIFDMHQGFTKISGSSVASGFDVELLYIADKMGYKIKEVPVHWLYVETRRVNPVKDSIKGLQALFEIRLNRMRNKYS